MKTITQKFINPSKELTAASIAVVASGYVPTGTKKAEAEGYYWADLLVPAGLIPDICTCQETEHRYERSLLAFEVDEFRTAKGLPKNAPEWARTLESRHLGVDGKECLGAGVEVVHYGEFTVVQLIKGGNGGWVEKDVYATRDGVNDHTKEFRVDRSESIKAEKILFLIEKGLTEDEAERLFGIDKNEWSPGQKSFIVYAAESLRKMLEVSLCKLSTAVSRSIQDSILKTEGVYDAAGDMSCPAIQGAAQKALWIFHGKNLEDVPKPQSKKVSAKPKSPEKAEPATVVATTVTTRKRVGPVDAIADENVSPADVAERYKHMKVARAIRAPKLSDVVKPSVEALPDSEDPASEKSKGKKPVPSPFCKMFRPGSMQSGICKLFSVESRADAKSVRSKVGASKADSEAVVNIVD